MSEDGCRPLHAPRSPARGHYGTRIVGMAGNSTFTRRSEPPADFLGSGDDEFGMDLDEVLDRPHVPAIQFLIGQLAHLVARFCGRTAAPR